MERMKKAISLLLVVAMLLTNCPVTAFASDADVLESGAFRYEVLEDGTLSICGYTGEPEDGLLHLEIPETLADTAVTQISGHAFEKAEVTTIAIPESIRRVADEAFAHCETLKAIAFCGPMPEMGKHLIEGCSSLEGVYLLAEEDATAQHAVLAAAGLTDIYLWKQEDLESLEAAFGEYKNDLDAAAAASEAGAVAETTEETIPETVSETTAETIPETVPETTVETIPEETESVTETWPEKIIQTLEVTVSQPASTGTGETTGFTYSVLNETQCAITGYTGTDTEIVIPAEIDGYQVHTIQSNAFKGKTALTSITLPEGLKRTESYAFQDCTSLTYIDLPDSITEMANLAFRNCTALAEIGYPAGWTTTLTSLNNTSYGDASVYYGTPFTGCNALKTITVDEGVTAIPAHAFRGMTSLEIIHLPESLTTIGVYAFAGCTELKAIEIPRSVTTINANSLEKCGSDLTIYCYNASAVHTTFENSGYTLYFLDEHDHVFSTEVQKAPTCAENGSTKTTCAICGYYYIEVQKAQGHSFGPWKMAQDSGCETGGSQYRVCTVCETEQTRELPANGHDYEDTVVLPTCSAQGRTVHICKVCGESYADAYVDPLQHSFGDWSTITEATVLACGIRTRVCSVCGMEETEEIPKVSINVEENQNYGMANFLVMDAVNLVPVSGASIFIATENDGEITLITDGEGKVSHVLPVGKWKASVCADGYIVRNITITVEPGVQDMPIIGISDRPMVDAKITVEEMTYEEMIAAGIDVGAKDNRHYYKWKCEIRFHEELYIPLDPVYKDSEGKSYTAPDPRPKTRNVYALSHEGAAVSKEHVTVYSSKEHGTYIKHRSSYENAIWTPEMGETIAFRNNGYYFEGYGLPSELTMTTQRAFPDIGWTQQAGTLAMKVGTRTHYLTYQEEEFRTVSSTKEVKSISLFEQAKVENDNYPTTAEYVYVPVSEPKEGGKYLLVQFDEAQTKKRDALSHEEDLVADVRMRIHRDDVLGEYITLEEAYRNAYWTTSYAANEGLRILNNQYFGFAGEDLTFDPLPDADGWTLEEDGRLSTINSEGETVYLLYTNDYSVTKSKSIASSVTLYQKTTVQDLVDGSGKLEEKTIYRFADTFQEGEEYVIFGGSIGNGSGGSSLPDGGGLPHPDGGYNPVRRGEGGGFNMPVIHQITEQY
ncbi:MAG: leucine-rich repeat protein, partial [Oscillospiraceae bacterium]|nr:leucine-rich repeat protein [Oscillospiraceae bacterium]